MSSLKDWYRYVDSRARTRPENEAPPERERPAGEPKDAEAPAAGASAATGAGEPSASPSPRGEAEPVVVGEEDLDVWAGLFPPQRKPEPKPTTAPLRRPTARLDELPADLPFARAPIDSPPAPQFPRPSAEVPIPSFDEFVSPFTPAPPAAAPTPGPSTVTGALPAHESDFPSPPAVERPDGEQLASTVEEEPCPPAVTGRDETRAEAPLDTAAAPSAVRPPAMPQSDPPAPALDAALSAALGKIVSTAAPSGPLPAGEAVPAPASSMMPAPSSEAAEAEAEPLATSHYPLATDEDEGQVPWRSPFQLPGPGRTVSSGAHSPRPEPIVPRALSPRPPGENPEAGGDPEHSQAGPRPAPGTEAWERERVERLARTFRETLSVLEQSRVIPRTRAPRETGGVARPIEEEPAAASRQREAALAELPVAEPAPLPADLATAAPPMAPMAEAAVLVAPPEALPGIPLAAEAAPVEAEAPLNGAPSASDLTFAASPDATPPVLSVIVTEAPGDAGAAVRPESVSRVAAEIPRPLEPIVEERAVAPGPRAAPPRPISSATPDVLRNIEEAALIRQRLPQHMAMLLRIPTNEVAQHSYKSPFRESREELIGRLLDPQLTLEEAARILGVCPTTVRRYTNRGMLQCHRTPGNQRRFRMSDVLQFLEQYGDRIDRAAEAPQFEEAA